MSDEYKSWHRRPPKTINVIRSGRKEATRETIRFPDSDMGIRVALRLLYLATQQHEHCPETQR